MKIRGAAIFVDKDSRLNDLLARLDAALEEVSRKHNLQVLTKRITLPFVGSVDEAKSMLKVIEPIARRRGYVYAGLNLMNPLDPSAVAGLMSEYGNTYASIWMPEYSDDIAQFYVGLLREVARRNPLDARRVAVLVGDLIETPYFPASINVKGGEGFSIALLYPGDLNVGLKELYGRIREVILKGSEFGEEVAERVNVEYRGVDASLSPWGSESVVGVVEGVFSVRFGYPGTMAAIGTLNRFIAEVPALKTGVNEVMLPLAEDEKLKLRFIEGYVDLGKLASYLQVCVAGVDMVPIPVGELDLVKNLLMDLSELARAKGRPIGLRLIPSTSHTVSFKDFGEAPTISLVTGRPIGPRSQ